MNNFLQRILSIVIISSISIPLVLYVENGVLYVFLPFALACFIEYAMLCITYPTDPFFAKRTKYQLTLGESNFDIIIRTTFSFVPIFSYLKTRQPEFMWIFIFTYMTAMLLPSTSDPAVNIEETLIGMLWICPSVIVCLSYGLEDPIKLIVICTTTWMGDGGGYIIGRFLGGKIFNEIEFWRFIRRISPSKTIEGSLGYLAFSLTFAYISTFFYHKISFENMIVLSFICGIFGQIGDLVESAFKRRKGIKDSGMFWNPFSSSGGLNDRMDSIYIALPATYIYLNYF